MPTVVISAAADSTHPAARPPIQRSDRRSAFGSEAIMLPQCRRAPHSVIAATVIQAPAACSSRNGNRAAAVLPVSSPYIAPKADDSFVTSQKNQQLKLTLLGTK